jgi:hypothetical protein
VIVQVEQEIVCMKIYDSSSFYRKTVCEVLIKKGPWKGAYGNKNSVLEFLYALIQPFNLYCSAFILLFNELCRTVFIFNCKYCQVNTIVQ